VKIAGIISNCPIASRFIDVNKMELSHHGSHNIALSGTVENLPYLPRDMADNFFADPGTVGTLLLEIFSEVAQGKAVCQVVSTGLSATGILQAYFAALQKQNIGWFTVRAVLDMGALLPSNMRANAREISHFLQNFESANQRIDGILFGDGGRFAILDRRDGAGEIIPLAALDDGALAYHGFMDRTRLFLLLGQAHCTGTNFSGLDPRARAAILVAPNAL
jgi:hypothetical protein